MSKQYFPGADNTTQRFDDNYPSNTMNTNCMVVHTTEGLNWPGYNGGGSAPNITIFMSIKERKMYVRSHFPSNKSGRALENRSGGVQTNTQNVFQIELIGTCDSTKRYKWNGLVAGRDYIYWPEAPDWALAELARVIKWLHDEYPAFKIKDGAPRGWLQYPSSYGNKNNQRLTFTEWNKLDGIIGHQHVPENSHGDPGDFKISRLVSLALGTNPVPDVPPVVIPPVIKDQMDPASYFIGAKGDHVTWLGERLVAHGFNKHFTTGQYYPGPSYSEIDRLNVQDFQEAQGWKGSDADGFPGAQSLKILAADPAPKPTEPPVEPEPEPEVPPVEPPKTVDKMDPKNYFIGATGDHVTWIGERLRIHFKALGFSDPYRVGPGSPYSETDRIAVSKFQAHVFNITEPKEFKKGGDADGFPGNQTLNMLAAEPKKSNGLLDVSSISLNDAAYDSKRGMKNRLSRVKPSAALVSKKKPMWIHFQEVSSDMVIPMDKALPDYIRVPAGGKGRESYYRRDAGIKIIASSLQNVKHMLKRDTKEFLLTAWEKDGFRALEVTFHNENEGKSIQKYQMKDVLTAAIKFADKYNIPYSNILVAGDSNRKETAKDIVAWNWKDAGTQAPKQKYSEFHSTNAWKYSTKGRRIDVNVVRHNAILVLFEQILSPIVSDHNAQYVVRRIQKNVV